MKTKEQININDPQSAHVMALSKAKIGLMASPDSAFFTTLCFSLRHKFDDSTPTACTDGKEILYSPTFFMNMSAEERIFLLLHETMHCAYLHGLRRGTKDPCKWNVACDHAINLQLIERGFKMPRDGLADKQYTGMSADEIYKALPENPKQSSFGNDIEDVDEGTEESKELRRHIEDILIQAQIQSKISNDKAGTIPGEVEIFLNRLLDPKLPWNQILQKYLHNFAKNDYTFNKPNRRFFPKYHLPSLYSEQLIDLAIAIDTSGSVTDQQFLQFITEVASIFKMMKPKKISLIQFDTEIKAVNEIKNFNELMHVKFTGRGGTAINPLINWANDNKPQLLMVFTDGYFYFSNQETKVNTIWLIHDNKQFNPPFGKTIGYSLKKA